VSFAWATVALLVLLLPGFLFSFGVYLPEKFTRESVQRDALVQLAAAVFVAFFIHALLFGLLGSRIDLEVVLATLQLQGAERMPLRELAEALRRSRWGILGYVLVASALGLGAGWAVGSAQQGILRRLVQYSWIYALKPDQNRAYVLAYVMTNVREAGRVLMYRGYLEQFGLMRNGTFAYLVLADPARYYMRLEEDGPRTDEPTAWRTIGAQSAGGGGAADTRTLSYLVVEGEDVANVVFERYEYTVPPGLLEVLLNDEKLARRLGVDPARLIFPPRSVLRDPPGGGRSAPISREPAPTKSTGQPKRSRRRKRRPPPEKDPTE
jgi:hypothetical protein